MSPFLVSYLIAAKAMVSKDSKSFASALLFSTLVASGFLITSIKASLSNFGRSAAVDALSIDSAYFSSAVSYSLSLIFPSLYRFCTISRSLVRSLMSFADCPLSPSTTPSTLPSINARVTFSICLETLNPLAPSSPISLNVRYIVSGVIFRWGTPALIMKFVTKVLTDSINVCAFLSKPKFLAKVLLVSI